MDGKKRGEVPETLDLTLESELGNLAKGAFIVALGHRLRDSMNSVSGMLRLLDASPLNNKQKEYIASAFSACDAMVKTLDEVSAFPVGTYDIPIDESTFNVYKAAKEILRSLETTALEKRIALSFNCAENTPDFIICDKLKLQQILAKIAEHLINRVEKGGVQIEISFEDKGDSQMLKFDAVSSLPSFLNAKSIEEIIDFSSSKWDGNPSDRRASLELAVCDAIARKMGGALTFSATPAATFTLAIPVKLPSQETLDDICRIHSEKDATGDSWQPVAPGKFNGTQVLLAEDDPINQSLGVAFLTNIGAKVDVAENGEKAVEKFKQDDYDIVFMDCDMPIMDGFDATKKIRQYEKESGTRRVPIVAMTAYARQGDKENCIAAGMDAHVPKPITVDTLKEVAKRFL